jgi:acid stress-induced BolA-like protein IbaG/YrbA
MMQPEQVEKIIAAAWSCEGHLSVGRRPSFRSPDRQRQFVGKSRSASADGQRLLKPHFDSGELHALSMKTQTPEEWSAARG